MKLWKGISEVHPIYTEAPTYRISWTYSKFWSLTLHFWTHTQVLLMSKLVTGLIYLLWKTSFFSFRGSATCLAGDMYRCHILTSMGWIWVMSKFHRAQAFFLSESTKSGNPAGFIQCTKALPSSLHEVCA